MFPKWPILYHVGCETGWWGAGVVICLDRGADLRTAQLMPLPLTVSCFSKIQIGFTFLVPAHLGSPGQRALKWVCVGCETLTRSVCLCVWPSLSVCLCISNDLSTCFKIFCYLWQWLDTDNGAVRYVLCLLDDIVSSCNGELSKIGHYLIVTHRGHFAFDGASVLHYLAVSTECLRCVWCMRLCGCEMERAIGGGGFSIPL